MFLNKPYLTKIARQSLKDSLANRYRLCTRNNYSYFAKSEFNLFLSHSYLDKTLVYTIVALFYDAGYSVYADWMVDAQLNRNNITSETAKALRDRMDTCHGLAYISTTNISASKWCPWELGYMDGKKNGRCAILPVLESETAEFSGREYLGIYPYIDYKKTNNGENEFWVHDPSNRKKYVSLREWLKGKEPYVHE